MTAWLLLMVGTECMADGIVPVPSDDSALACLDAHADGSGPVYPEDDLARKESGLFRVKLRFSSRTASPDVEFFYSGGSDAMRRAVWRYVERYRLPCMPDGARAIVATQEFSFSPDDRPVSWSRPRQDTERQIGEAKCLKDGLSAADRHSMFPIALLKQGVQGRVLLRLRFEAPDQAPNVEVVFDGGSAALAKAAAKIAAKSRMPCLDPAGEPFVGTQMFSFQIDGEPLSVFKDLSLRQFLGAVADLDQQKVRFDLNTMHCPFDLKIALYQPYMPNGVGEVGDADPNRREFVEWIKTLSLALSKRKLQQVLGDTMTVSVPCGTIDLF